MPLDAHSQLCRLHRALLRAVQVNTNILEFIIEDEPFLIPSLKQRIEEQVVLNKQLKAFASAK